MSILFLALSSHPKISWLFLFLIFGIVCMMYFHTIFKKDSTAKISTLTFTCILIALAIPFATQSILMFMTESWIALIFATQSTIVVMFILGVLILGRNNEKSVNILAWIYYICMIAACVFTYLQW